MADYTPTRDEIARVWHSLLPPGRAFQRYGSFVSKDQSVMKQFIYALAGPWLDFETAMSALLDEYSVFTAIQNIDLWMEEYGLPNDCDPFGEDLIAKVTDVGGVAPSYYAGLAAALGWDADIRWLTGYDSVYPGVRATLYVGVRSASSSRISDFDIARVEDSSVESASVGLPDVTQLLCVLDVVVPAQSAIIYEVLT